MMIIKVILYFIFPLRMLQIGSIGLDPFIGRRFSSLGGQSFLDSFVLSMLSEKNLNIIDSGVGLIVAVGVFWGLFKSDQNLTNRQSIFLIFLFLLIRMGKVNITSVIIALALFVSLYRLLNSSKFKEENFLGYCFILALVASAIFTLKSNLIIPFHPEKLF
jgi:hypothetical protein